MSYEPKISHTLIGTFLFSIDPFPISQVFWIYPDIYNAQSCHPKMVHCMITNATNQRATCMIDKMVSLTIFLRPASHKYSYSVWRKCHTWHWAERYANLDKQNSGEGTSNKIAHWWGIWDSGIWKQSTDRTFVERFPRTFWRTYKATGLWECSADE